ncbi:MULTISPECIES: hypothetical protein [Arenibacter]|uniref:hypothetical protein n=1 Tax=Arenibacter TaxID=178469 RepID=UPI0012FFF958|nr:MULTISPECIES: hypothetical protein [Arenibacter]
MKNSLIVLGILCSTYMGYSQKLIKAVNLEEVTISPILNHSYRNVVYVEATPDFVKNLQTEAAAYDVRKDPEYYKSPSPYVVYFAQTNGSIIATYDPYGRVISTLERFKDVTPPQPVRNSVYVKYPNWTMDKNRYMVTYYKGKRPTKIYQLKLRKGNVKKKLKVDADGKIL